MNPPSFAVTSKKVLRGCTLALLAAAAGQLRAETAQPVNLSTRMRVETGENVGIAGFIISGSVEKHVVVRALGPSLNSAGLTDLVKDPYLELYDSNGTLLISNDNWKDDPEQKEQLEIDNLAPTNDLESAVDVLVPPGTYTAAARGNDGGSGLGLIEVYDLSPSANSKLANISTRALVQTGDNVVIAGFVLGDGAENTLAIRGIGPSLETQGVSNWLPDPTLEIRNASGTLVVSNDDWADSASQARLLSNVGLMPHRELESGIVGAFAPGAYTALLADLKKRSGVGLIEVYDLATANPGADVAQVTQPKKGDVSAIEKQEVSFIPAQTSGTFVIQVYKPSSINPSAIGARAALFGQTEPIPFTATAAEIVDALTSISNAYYAYGQGGNVELIAGSFSYFASHGALNREPVVTSASGGTAAAGFTIEFGSLVGTTATFPGYNTWVAGMPRITVTISKK